MVLPVYAVDAEEQETQSEAFDLLLDFGDGEQFSYINDLPQTYSNDITSLLFKGLSSTKFAANSTDNNYRDAANFSGFSAAPLVDNSGHSVYLYTYSDSVYYPFYGVNPSSGVTLGLYFQALNGVFIHSVNFKGSFAFNISTNGGGIYLYPTSAALKCTTSSGQTRTLATLTFTGSGNTQHVVSFPGTDIVIDSEVSSLWAEMVFSFSPSTYTTNFLYRATPTWSFWYQFSNYSGTWEEPPQPTFEDKTLGFLSQIIAQLRSTDSVIASGFANVLQGIQNVIDAIGSLGSGFSSTPEQDAAASQYVQDMEDTMQKIDEANQVIEDNTNRPAADSLVPAVPDIIQDGQIGGGDVVATAMMGDFGDLLSSPLILNLLLMVFGLAFLSYVLFGKKE